jgi:hypothetical protein
MSLHPVESPPFKNQIVRKGEVKLPYLDKCAGVHNLGA